MMSSEINPRHSIKARRKQKEETVDLLPNIGTEIPGHHNDDDDNDDDDNDDGMDDVAEEVDKHHHISNSTDPAVDSAWRNRYEAAVRKRRSPIATTAATNTTGNSDWGNHTTTTTPQNNRLSNLSPSSNKSSTINSITSMSQADMEFILATSMDDGTYDIDQQMNDLDMMNHNNRTTTSDRHNHHHAIDDSMSPTSNYSADSIIRRVEAEIAAARKSAAMAKHNQYYNQNRQHRNPNNNNKSAHGDDVGEDDDDDDDMAQILNTTNTFSDHNHGAMSPSMASDDDSSKLRAMDLIHDEFRTSARTDLDSPVTATTTGVETNTNTNTTTTVEFYAPQSVTGTTAINATNNDSLWHTTPSTASNSFLMNLRQTTQDMVKKDETIMLQHPFEEKKEDTGTNSSNVVTKDVQPGPDFGTPTRSNARRAIVKEDPEATLVISRNNNDNNNIEPDGEYQETATPRRRRRQQHQQRNSNTITGSGGDQKQQISEGTGSGTVNAAASLINSDPSLPPPPPPPPLTSIQQQRQPSPMDKTRELLDSLKEQRQSLRQSPVPPNNVHREAADMKESERPNSFFQPPPSSPSARNQPPRQVFPEEVYDLVTENNEKSSTDVTAAGAATSSSSSDQCRRIRFRNPFPLLKPPTVHRSLDEMIHDHAMDIPDIPVRWLKPKQELKQLIVAAMGTSLPRRSNACGALKVLTRQEKNQLSLVRTDGFLQSITYAASQSVLDVDTDLAIDARTRAVTCFKNVCHPKDNRIIILNHPGVIECLLKVVQNDDGAGRATAAAAIALLAKTPQCRECLVHIEGLVDTLAKVMHSASTMISDEAMVVRNTPRSGSYNSVAQNYVNKALSNTRDENSAPIDSSVNQIDTNNEKIPINRNDPDPDVATSSSLSSGEDGGNNNTSNPNNDSPTKTTNGEIITLIGSKLYDVRSVDSIRNQTEERYDEFVNQARCNACAALLHISKQCATSHDLATNHTFVSCVAAVAREVDHPIHTKCLEILCNLTRLPMNNSILTRFDGIIETFIMASNSTNPINRLAALHALQNISSDAGSKTLLATSAVLNLLTSCAMRKDVEEKDIAVATLYNITTEPGAVTAITNTKNVVATLVHLAHSPDSSSGVRLLACESLATISLWLQTLAGTGKVPDNVINVPLPSQKTTGWERWD